MLINSNPPCALHLPNFEIACVITPWIVLTQANYYYKFFLHMHINEVICDDGL